MVVLDEDMWGEQQNEYNDIERVAWNRKDNGFSLGYFTVVTRTHTHTHTHTYLCVCLCAKSLQLYLTLRPYGL